MKPIGWLGLLAGLLAAGCATNLERADRRMAERRYAEARDDYRLALDEQRHEGVTPRWNGKEYQ